MSMKAPIYKFSIIIPCYNRPESLEQCLKCLAQQTVPSKDYEIIIVDDGSKVPLEDTDIDSFSRLNIKLLRQETARGPSAARNRGISAAEGEIICFTDSDCEPEPDWLEQVGISFDSGNVDYVGGATNCRRNGKYADFPYSDNPFSVYELKPGDIHFPTCNLAFRREVLERCRFDESRYHLWLEDSELCWQAHRLGYKAAYNPKMFVIHPVRYVYFFKNFAKQKKLINVGYVRNKFLDEFDEEFLSHFRFTNWTGETKYFFLILAIILCFILRYRLLAILGILLSAKYIRRKILQLFVIYRAIPLYQGQKGLAFYLDLLLTYFFTPLISLTRSFYVFVGAIKYGQIIL